MSVGRLAALAAADGLVWAGLSVVVGWTANRLPVEHFERDGPVTRLWPVEVDGDAYRRRLRVHRWKDHVPEAGALFAGGMSKRALPGRHAGGLARFAAETRRAERVHWVLMACGPLFLLWNPAPLGAAMIAYAVLANGPCILIQRYNRGRLVRLARQQRPGPTAR